MIQVKNAILIDDRVMAKDFLGKYSLDAGFVRTVARSGITISQRIAEMLLTGKNYGGLA